MRDPELTSGLERTVIYVSLLTLLIALSVSCGPAPDTFGKLDLKKWRGDRGGCNGVRSTLVPAFRAEIQNLKGNSANTIGELLGRPDINQIADRNQKYYIYFLEKGTHCDRPSEKSNSPSVAIRMSAIGLATEVTFQNGLP
ncbi:hypothetical protein GCM10027423_27410 [Spirosoma arcticum]